MAINLFSRPRPTWPPPRAVPSGVIPLYGQENADYFPRTSPEKFQRISNHFMQEPELYDDVRELGCGGNGKAILLERRTDSSLLVVKISNPFTGWTTNTIDNEVFLLKHRLPTNDRIIRVINYLQSAHVPQVQTYLEYCNGGDLANLMRHYTNHSRTPPESFAWHAFRQIAEGLAFIHHGYDHKLGPNQNRTDNWKKVIHADLKPENIFLRTSKDPRDYPDLVLGDFGNSHTAADYHEAGTKIWLPPESTWVSEYGDTWTMGAIISSLAWRGAAPVRRGHSSFQQAIEYPGSPIVIEHKFGIPAHSRHRCEYERDEILVRPMLSYSHELNDLVAWTCHPHFDERLGSWDCLQWIWYHFEVGAARSLPIVPLLPGWEEVLPNPGLRDEGEASTPKESNRPDDNRTNHGSSSSDSNDDGQDPPDRGRTRKTKYVEEDSHQENGSDLYRSGNGSNDDGKDIEVYEDSHQESNEKGESPDQGLTKKRKHVEEDSQQESNDGGESSDEGRTKKRKHVEEDSQQESNDGGESSDEGRTKKRKHVEEDSHQESNDKKDPSGQGPTRERRHFEGDSDEEVRTYPDHWRYNYGP